MIIRVRSQEGHSVSYLRQLNWLASSSSSHIMASSKGSIFRVAGFYVANSPANSPHKGQWRGALMLSLMCAWINKQRRRRGFDAPFCSLWYHCNVRKRSKFHVTCPSQWESTDMYPHREPAMRNWFHDNKADILQPHGNRAIQRSVCFMECPV